MYEVEHLIHSQNQLGESPLWHPQEQAFYWVDILDNRFFRYSPKNQQTDTFDVGDRVGCLAFHESGNLLLGTSQGIELWQNGQRQVTRNRAYHPNNRLNDGAVDRHGRFWVGAASPDPVNHLYCMMLDGEVFVREKNILISNGIGWSPDNTIMYYSDSGGEGIVYQYDFDISTGRISNQQIFLPPTGTDIAADGLTVDAEGHIWIAYWNGWKIARYAPDGTLIQEIDMPIQRPTSLCFGGAELNQLYITSASVDVDKTQQPLAGDVFRIQTDTKGIPEPIAKIHLGLLDFDIL